MDTMVTLTRWLSQGLNWITGKLPVAYFWIQPDPARPSHRPAIFKNESQECRTGNLGSAALAVLQKVKFTARYLIS